MQDSLIKEMTRNLRANNRIAEFVFTYSLKMNW